MNPSNSPPEEPSSTPLNGFLSEARVRELIRIEEECGCANVAGRNWGTQMGLFLQDPVEMECLAQLRDWMLSESRLLLSEWKLGRITDTLHAIGQQRLIERFRQPPPETQELLWHLFERSNHSSEALSRANDDQAEVRAVIARTLTAADWQALTQAAVSTLEQYLSMQQKELNRKD